MKNRVLLIFACAMLFLACKNEKSFQEKSTGAKDDAVKKEVISSSQKGQNLLDKCILAHGGITLWKQFEGLEYNLNDNGKLVYQLTNIKDRRAYLRAKDYEVGFDGEVAWAIPNANKVSGQSAAFYYNLDFYFIGIPFLLKDPGVHVDYAGITKINNTDFETLKVTFGANVGLTPNDVYYAYLDTKTYMLQILTYSISYFDAESAEINTAKVYSDYKVVQGIAMPGKMENFVWDNGEIGERKNHVRFVKDIKFLNKIKDPSIFEVPEGAVVEKIVN